MPCDCCAAIAQPPGVKVANDMDVRQKAPAGNGSRPVRANPVCGCPLTAALAAVGGKWKLIIVYWLARSPAHFAALRKQIPGISQKVLTQQLRELISDGIVHRDPKGPVPAPVEYSNQKRQPAFLVSQRTCQ